LDLLVRGPVLHHDNHDSAPSYQLPEFSGSPALLTPSS
jgi:hypothetical protein